MIPPEESARREAFPVVFVLGDDGRFREAARRLLRVAGLRVHAFASVDGFLQGRRPDAPGCLLLSERMSGPDGGETLRRLAEADVHLPFVFVAEPLSPREVVDRVFEALDPDRLIPK
jgi:FixJ family two-component response regulator